MINTGNIDCDSWFWRFDAWLALSFLNPSEVEHRDGRVHHSKVAHLMITGSKGCRQEGSRASCTA